MPYKHSLAERRTMPEYAHLFTDERIEKRRLENVAQTRRWKKTPHGAAKVKEYAKKYRAKHRASLSNKQTIYIRKKRVTLIELMDSKCVCCGEDDPIYLQVDHVYNDGYKDNVRTSSGISRAKVTVKQYLETPDRFQLLCSNCNHAKHKNGGKLYKPKRKRRKDDS